MYSPAILALLFDSPWYNRTGWLGVKHQLTYSIFIIFISSFYFYEQESFVYMSNAVNSFSFQRSRQPDSNYGFLDLCRVQNNTRAKKQLPSVII